MASGKPYSINGVVWNRYPADENGNPQASDCFWSSGNLSISALTTFEKGYFYRCTVIFTTPKDGYSWAPSGLGASLNGEKLDFSPKVITGGIHLVQSGYLDLTSSKEITQAAVSGATLTLPASGLPAFTASVPDGADYEIDDEAWMDENGKYYTSNESKNAFLETQGLLLTEFTKGKTYTYSVTLKPKDSKHAFPKDLTQIAFTFDGKSVPLTSANATLANGYLMVDHLATYTIPDENTLTNLVVEDATLTLVDGQAPKFTGHAPADADYELYQEGWEEVETGKYICNRYTTGLTAFEAGKTYSYCLYFLMKSTGKVFSPDAKDVTLTINGKQISAANLPYAPNTYLSEVHIDDSVVVTVVKSGESGGTSFIEPDYYPDYAENEDDAFAPESCYPILMKILCKGRNPHEKSRPHPAPLARRAARDRAGLCRLCVHRLPPHPRPSGAGRAPRRKRGGNRPRRGRADRAELEHRLRRLRGRLQLFHGRRLGKLGVEPRTFE